MDKKEEQTLILVDDSDKILGYAPRTECHTDNGRRHRAYALALYSKKGEILLQERKHWLWDRVWDLTLASHPLHINGKNETYISSAARRLGEEWGITGVKLRNIGAFNYFEKYRESCENEHCALIVGEYNKEPKINPEVAYGFRWIALSALKSEVAANPKKFTPWLIEALAILEKEKGLKLSSVL